MVINGKIASLKFWIVKSFYRVRNQKPWNLQLWPQLKSGCDDQLNKANFRRCYLIILKRESLLQQTNTLWKLPISSNSRFLWGSGVPILLIITKKSHFISIVIPLMYIITRIEHVLIILPLQNQTLCSKYREFQNFWFTFWF